MIGERLDVKEKRFDFKCPHCLSEKIEFKPIGVSYRPITVQEDLVLDCTGDADDTKMSESIMKHYNDLPYLKDALLDSEKEQVSGYCKGCDTGFSVVGNLDKNEYRTWLNKWANITGNEPPAMILRV